MVNKIFEDKNAEKYEIVDFLHFSRQLSPLNTPSASHYISVLWAPPHFIPTTIPHSHHYP